MKPNQTISNWPGKLAAFAAAIISVAVLGFVPVAHAEPSSTWTGGSSSSSSWGDAANWGGTLPSYGQITFAGSARTVNSMDASTSQNLVFWSGTSTWTFNNSGGAVLSLFDYSGGQCKVENDSTGLVTINAPITYASNNGSPPNPFGELNAVNAGINFGTAATLTVNGSSINGIKLFGGGQTINFSNTVSASGKWFGITTSGTGNTININGSFTSGDFYVMNGGTVNLKNGGAFSTSAVRLGGDFGTTGNQNQAASGTFNLAATAGGLNYGSVINAVTGNTSGALSVNSQNAGGTDTLSGHIALDAPLKIAQSAGGTLNITQNTNGTTTAGTDIKAQTLTLAPAAGGTINYSGQIWNSTGAGGVTINGGGTVIYSGAEIYSGATTVSSGNLTAAAGGSLSNSVVAVASGASFTVSNSCSVPELHEAGSGNGGTATIASGVVLTVNGGSLGTFYMNSISGGGGLTMAGSGSQMQLYGSQTYSGNTTINAGTLGLQNGYALPNGSSVVIAAGGTLDLSAVTSPYNWGSSAGLAAGGTGTTVGSSAAAIKGPSGGTVSLGSQPITLTYDGSHPALYISQGTLVLNGNAFTVNSSSALALGTYTIAQQASGSVGSSGPYTVTGTAVGSGKTGSISVSSSNVVLTILNTTTTTLTRTAGASPSTYGGSLTFHAVVSPAPADGTTITFLTNGVSIGTATTTSGAANLTISTLQYSGGSAYTVAASFAGDSSNAGSSGTLSGGQQVNALAVQLTGSRNYDGTTNAAAAILSVANKVGGDTVNVTPGTGGLAGKNIGTQAIASFGTLALGNNAAGNYTLSGAGGSVTVGATNITVTAAANTKNYDGTTNAATTPAVTSGGVQTGDAASFTESYNDKNAGTGKTLTPRGVVTDGNSGLNYNYTYVTAAAGVISKTNLTVTTAANTKTYDGTTSVAAVPAVTSGSLQGADTASFTETYDTKNAGSGKTLTPAGVVTDGNSGNNYNYTYTTAATGVISATNITVTAAANTKNYDGTTSAAAVPAVTSGSVQAGDTGNFTEGYAGRNVGTGLTLTPAGSVTDGNGGNNYSVTFANSTMGVINATNITVTAATNTKTYDGTTSAAAVPAITSGGLQGTDGASFMETYDTKNAGTGKTLTPAGSVSDGNGGNNYNVTFADNTTGVINQANTSVSVASSENPSGYNDSVVFTVTLPADATGNVNFLTNGVLFDTEPLNSGSTTTTNSTLPRGTNEITAQYAGDINYLGGTNDLAGGQVVTNHPPVAGDATYYRAKGISLQITISDLLTNVTDADGDAITLTGVGTSATGATILTNATTIYYLPSTGASSNANDSFTYTVGDGFGGSATGNINVDVYSAVGSAQMSIPSNGVVNIKFFGIPAYTYVVATTTNLNSAWWPLSTNTAGSDGSWQFTDPNATNSQQYYRTQQP